MKAKPTRASILLEPLMPVVRPAVFEGPKIVIEKRYIGNELKDAVLLDSIASMANRMEEALHAQRDRLGFNDIAVDFGNGERYSQWRLPHRVYDAAVRDSMHNGKFFFETDLGKQLARGEPQSLFQWAPNVLLFGGWNSHAQSGIGARFAARVERAVVAEVVGLDPKTASRPGSRRDPLGVPGDAALPEGMRERAEQIGKESKKLSDLGYGNIPPTLQELDVSISEARLHFLVTPLPWIQRRLPQEAQEVLLLLALLGLTLLVGDGYLHLRSGTTFRVKGPVRLEVPGEEGMELPEPDQLVSRMGEALGKLPEGWRWKGEELVLEPSPALRELVEGQEELRREARRGRGGKA
ncbi:type I-U CRISPR-associated RAMP protein Csb1/Cas7u [Thermus sp.]|uniref:type I-G CRISPR-associated RAMP protein Csb1/Cas7g n=1 Tax=Thermus sp. TaxID=275 RepID=UPI00298F1F7A|nr:type I-U CRISPR-associated RAMP protein Csb1/Cas7u [Thermus sp.]MDW8358718.1 type I-U CRISPR-associated RAMP protein Csb1/Cas7u [Thermus sp.]